MQRSDPRPVPCERSPHPRGHRRARQVCDPLGEMEDLAALLGAVVPAGHLLVGDAVGEDYGHDESLTVDSVTPAAVVTPGSTSEVAAVLRVADEHHIPVTARGSGTGLSGACTPTAASIV